MKAAEGDITVATTGSNRRWPGRRVGRSPGVGVLAALEGAALIGWHVVATPFIGRRRLRWGTIGTEATDPLPGDELVPQPKWSNTLAITVDASPADVWPWIAQLGQGRGGFYTYQTLENLVGCQITNTTEILPEHQQPVVGDSIYLAAGAPPLTIEIVDPPRALVLFGSPADVDGGIRGKSTWQFIIKPGSGSSSRLLVRARYEFGSDWKSRRVFGRFPLEAITYAMSRKMMLEIKRLAERQAEQGRIRETRNREL